MSEDLFRRMRTGDREALREVLDSCGGALFALWQALDAEGERGDLAEVGAAIWRASVTAGRGAEVRSTVLVAAATHLVGVPVEQGPAPEVDRPLFVDACARGALRIADTFEIELVEKALQNEPHLAELKGRVDHAISAAEAVPEGAPSPFATLWSTLEPRLV